VNVLPHTGELALKSDQPVQILETSLIVCLGLLHILQQLSQTVDAIVFIVVHQRSPRLEAAVLVNFMDILNNREIVLRQRQNQSRVQVEVLLRGSGVVLEESRCPALHQSKGTKPLLPDIKVSPFSTELGKFDRIHGYYISTAPESTEKIDGK
jgi:hypothetical protein